LLEISSRTGRVYDAGFHRRDHWQFLEHRHDRPQTVSSCCLMLDSLPIADAHPLFFLVRLVPQDGNDITR
jgi:hypothetical protein